MAATVKGKTQFELIKCWLIIVEAFFFWQSCTVVRRLSAIGLRTLILLDLLADLVQHNAQTSLSSSRMLLQLMVQMLQSRGYTLPIHIMHIICTSTRQGCKRRSRAVRLPVEISEKQSAQFVDVFFLYPPLMVACNQRMDASDLILVYWVYCFTARILVDLMTLHS